MLDWVRVFKYKQEKCFPWSNLVTDQVLTEITLYLSKVIWLFTIKKWDL